MRQNLLLFAALGLVLAEPASAAVYLINFGYGGSATNIPTTDAEKKNSPYHTETPAFTDTAWNNLTTADATGLIDSGGAISSVGINLGIAGSTGSKVINLSTQPSGQAALTGTSVNSGVYAGNSIGRYGIFSNSTANNVDSNRIALGVQISGLAAGTYDIYTLTRNTNTIGGQTFAVHLGTSSTAGDFDFSGYSNESITMSTGATEAWADNSNYLKQTITIAAGQFLNIAVDGTATQTRGFLNALQIVAVPEPSSLLLILPCLAGVMIRRKRI